MTHAQIIEREFRNALRLDASASVSASFNANEETINVWVDGDTYTMQIGSDDDCFYFECDTAPPVTFDIPDDYITADMQGP